MLGGQLSIYSLAFLQRPCKDGTREVRPPIRVGTGAKLVDGLALGECTDCNPLRRPSRRGVAAVQSPRR